MKRILFFIITCCYIGYLPYLPGTYTSAFGCIILYLISPISIATGIVLGLFFVIFSVIVINLSEYEGEDPSYIVIDELAGIFCTMAGHKISILSLIIGFCLFRLFDIVKPYPISLFERLKAGYGIVADDVVAAIFANAGLYLILFLIGVITR